MTKYSALQKAALSWSRLGPSFATIRHKTVTDRFEVGYWDKKQRIVLGAGPTWEIAFERALRARP